MLAFLLPSVHYKDVGALQKKPFKTKLKFDAIWGPDPRPDSSKGNVSFYFARVWYRPIRTFNKNAPADTERENVLENVLSLCDNKVCVFN